MTRLVAFGCSFTYGQGLDDTQDSWPSVLANRLGIPVVNEGKPSAGNLEILHRILNFDFQNDDIVAILWTYYSRDFLFKAPTYLRSIGPWISDINELQAWAATHTDYDLMIRTYINIHHAHSYLASLKIKQIHATLGIKTERGIKNRNPAPDFFKIKLHNLEKTFANGGKLADGHPDKQTYQNVAKEIYDIISESAV